MLTATVLPESGQPPEALLGITGLLDAGATGPDVPCQANNPDLWFADKPAELEHAKVLCSDCPLRAQCLAGALERHEPWGVWGGEIFERGVVIPRKRPRGRPRKEDRRHEELTTIRATQQTIAPRTAARQGQEAAA
jgi:WhiB family redox-sensing transcriptional regulator